MIGKSTRKVSLSGSVLHRTNLTSYNSFKLCNQLLVYNDFYYEANFQIGQIIWDARYFDRLGRCKYTSLIICILGITRLQIHSL